MENFITLQPIIQPNFALFLDFTTNTSQLANRLYSFEIFSNQERQSVNHIVDPYKQNEELYGLLQLKNVLVSKVLVALRQSKNDSVASLISNAFELYMETNSSCNLPTMDPQSSQTQHFKIFGRPGKPRIMFRTPENSFVHSIRKIDLHWVKFTFNDFVQNLLLCCENVSSITIMDAIIKKSDLPLREQHQNLNLSKLKMLHYGERNESGAEWDHKIFSFILYLLNYQIDLSLALKDLWAKGFNLTVTWNSKRILEMTPLDGHLYVATDTNLNIDNLLESMVNPKTAQSQLENLFCQGIRFDLTNVPLTINKLVLHYVSSDSLDKFDNEFFRNLSKFKNLTCLVLKFKYITMIDLEHLAGAVKLNHLCIEFAHVKCHQDFPQFYFNKLNLAVFYMCIFVGPVLSKREDTLKPCDGSLLKIVRQEDVPDGSVSQSQDNLVDWRAKQMMFERKYQLEPDPLELKSLADHFLDEYF